jgi:hypothetical protein
MPARPASRSSPRHGLRLSTGITILPLLLHSYAKDAAVFRSSRSHLEQVRETYFQHLRAALGISVRLAGASAACALHALIPALCTRTASRRVAELNTHLTSRNA